MRDINTNPPLARESNQWREEDPHQEGARGQARETS